ncbi:MAG: hypothetical protein HQM12_21425 [SAR324 cluster bacterium]|nr:hypothetical protein [SAR324 cluster bacterium]MBF0349803.1 hypothetical protein [SAR324 cluster bacterium]
MSWYLFSVCLIRFPCDIYGAEASSPDSKPQASTKDAVTTDNQSTDNPPQVLSEEEQAQQLIEAQKRQQQLDISRRVFEMAKKLSDQRVPPPTAQEMKIANDIIKLAKEDASKQTYEKMQQRVVDALAKNKAERERLQAQETAKLQIKYYEFLKNTRKNSVQQGKAPDYSNYNQQFKPIVRKK